jgi:hypothetical protein
MNMKSAPLDNVVEGLGKLGDHFTKWECIVIVGGPGNSMD